MGQCVFLFGQKSSFNCAGLDPHVRKIRPLDGQENEPDFDQLRLLFSCRRVLPSCVRFVMWESGLCARFSVRYIEQNYRAGVICRDSTSGARVSELLPRVRAIYGGTDIPV